MAWNCWNAPKCKKIVPFQKDLRNLVNILKFSKIKSKCQRQLKEDIKVIKQNKQSFSISDKTSNIYKLNTDEYKKINKPSHQLTEMLLIK